MPYSAPSTSVEVSASGFPSGLTGTIGVRVTDGAGGTTQARKTTGISEYPASSGIYITTLTAPATAGQYQVIWDTGGASPQFAADDLIVVTDELVDVLPSGTDTTTYTTPARVRSYLGYTTQQLSDDAATEIILEAEDAVDGLLGGWVPNASTGRKIKEGDVEGWQWIKLRRATTILAGKIVLDPDLIGGQQWRSIQGPDFSFSGPLSGRIPSRVVDLLTDSGLRRLTGYAHTARIAAAVNLDDVHWTEAD